MRRTLAAAAIFAGVAGFVDCRRSSPTGPGGSSASTKTFHGTLESANYAATVLDVTVTVAGSDLAATGSAATQAVSGSYTTGNGITGHVTGSLAGTLDLGTFSGDLLYDTSPLGAVNCNGTASFTGAVNGSGIDWSSAGFHSTCAGDPTAVRARATPGSVPPPANRPPVVTAITATPDRGLQSGTPIACSAQASDPDGDPLTFTWDFGDGQHAKGAAPTHVYQSAGSFAASVVISDGHASVTGYADVKIVSLTGIWFHQILDNGNPIPGDGMYLNIVQDGSTITGIEQFFIPNFPGCCFVINPITKGVVRSSGPHVLLDVQATQSSSGSNPGGPLPLCYILDPTSDVGALEGAAVDGTCTDGYKPFNPASGLRFVPTNIVPHPILAPRGSLGFPWRSPHG